MKREILFRGKTKDGRWVYGDLVRRLVETTWQDILGEYQFAIAGKGEREKTVDFKNKRAEVISCTTVDPATVGQYVFLEDTKDKKIFTGDILKDPDREGIYVIDFIGGGFGLFTMKEYLDLKHRHTVILWDGLSEPQTACFVTQNLEVIGNIHEHNHLLG